MPTRPSGPVATLDFQLLESSAGGFMTQQLRHQQQPLGASGMGKSTAVVLKLVRQELDMQSAAGQPDPAVSFLSLAQRLTRAEAVKLFMQVLVTQTAGFTRAAQNRPFGDILIRQGGVLSS
ncbi:uncharacterized protein HaLaN_16961 [Haematococcus lacustris]|uniref:Rad21/Rec8-like protein C-terminal eukaryotic domain-containing protein n=1 Tax=Haematococcus lacustris TaxID=44745 RepID=A0A699ZK17_HAELA|nr:uncharacterized protein HaLaN_16961 [Haematococcus lacustris]